jgi:sugar O-acyltransferase (sialic acid O-acetyltransferase NeuD family)
LISPKYKCIGFLDDDTDKLGEDYYGSKVIGSISEAVNFKDVYFVNGVGSSLNFWKKKEIINKTLTPNHRFETIIHPTSSVSKFSKIGLGTVIFQNVTIASNVKIGSHVIILPNTVVSHDNTIGDYTSITSGVCISGGVTIGESCYLGANCSIIGNIDIGDYSLIGMNSNVLKNVNKNSVMTGNPATFMRKTLSDQ